MADAKDQTVFDVFALTPEVLKLPAADRKKYIDEHCQTKSGGFASGALTRKAPITLVEELAVMLFFLVVMGGPLLWTFVFPVVMLLLGASARSWYVVL